jgi:CHAT domain-containing protein
VQERSRLAWEAGRLARTEKTAEARDTLAKLLDLEREIFGAESHDLAGALEFVAYIQEGMGDCDSARASLTQAVALRTKLAGKDDYRTVDARYALARIERLASLNAEQRRALREAMQMVRKADQVNRFQQRERAEGYKQAVNLLKKTLGPAHPEVAAILQRHAERTGFNRSDSETAALYKEALSIRKQALGAKHPECADSLEGLARCDLDHAASLLGEALTIRKQTQGELHPAFTRTLERLGLELMKHEKQAEEAADVFKQGLAIRQKLFGPDDLGSGNLRTYLVNYYRKIRHFAEAEQYILQQVETARRRLERQEDVAYEGRWTTSLGIPPEQANNPRMGWTAAVKRLSYALALKSLSGLYSEMEKYERAAQLMGESLDYHEEFQQMLGAVVSESEQQNLSAGMTSIGLYDYLSLACEPRAKIRAEEAYRHVLAWKGGTFLRERRARAWRDRPDLKPLYAELATVSAKLGAALRSAPADDNRAAWDDITTLLVRREELESTLTHRIERLGLEAKRDRPTPARLQATLPGDAVLIDFVRFFQFQGGIRQNNYHLAAFVIRSKGPVVRVELGPIRSIEDAITAWRDGGQHVLAAADASLRLGRMIWEPLAGHVGNAATLLIAPDGELSRFPWGTLPGKSLNTYLLEDHALVLVPVPQLLIAGTTAPLLGTGCVVVGDIDFGNPPKSPRPGPALYFPPLAGTNREVKFLGALYGRTFPSTPLLTLRGSGATKPALRQAIGRSRYVHLATHGFFEPELPRVAPGGSPVRQQVIMSTPGLRAGIALSGANVPVRPGRDDGILTADEAQQLDLDGTDLVVLSACESSLGSQIVGEGMMGLQRAFQVAGARSLISSLWPVSDAATSVLMEEFYTNLWERKLPKLEALRQAQLRVMREPEIVVKRLRELREEMAKRGWSETQLAARGLDQRAEHMPAASRGSTLRSPGMWWAAFVLSGDWR